MPEIECPRCRQKLFLPPDWEAPEAACPKCKSEFEVPVQATVAPIPPPLPKSVAQRVREKRTPGIPRWIAYPSLAGVAVVVVALMAVLVPWKGTSIAETNSIKRAVDVYLKAHLNDPEYQVVEWYPAIRGKHRGKPTTFVRLIYREKTFLGWILTHKTFGIGEDGKVEWSAEWPFVANPEEWAQWVKVHSQVKPQ